jgi:hypothetical protein
MLKLNAFQKINKGAKIHVNTEESGKKLRILRNVRQNGSFRSFCIMYVAENFAKPED